MAVFRLAALGKPQNSSAALAEVASCTGAGFASKRPVRGLATQSAMASPRRPNARTQSSAVNKDVGKCSGFLPPCRRAVDPFHIHVRAVRVLVLLVLHGSRAVFGRSWRIAPGPSRDNHPAARRRSTGVDFRHRLACLILINSTDDIGSVVNPEDLRFTFSKRLSATCRWCA